MLNVLHLQKILNSQLYIPQDKANFKLDKIIFNEISIDNRTIQNSSLFIAVKGEKFDGHSFVEHLNTTHIAIVDRYIQNAPHIIQVIVSDTKKALQQLANYWRNLFDIPIVAVVGSNGKTSVKEMIHSIFSYAVGKEYTIATKGNLNNDIGLPLSILKLRHTHKLAVFEIGMNHPQETTLLAQILQPTIAIINNAQREHQEFMHNLQTVAIEHGYLLEETSKLKSAVLPFDSEFYSLWQAQCLKNNIALISFSMDYQNSDFYAKFSQVNGEFILNNIYPIKINALGLHNISNALAAISVAKCAGISLDSIVKGIQTYAGVKGRLQKSSLITAHKNINLINDTYNANPDSVKVAIDVLASLNGKKLLILGDMGEVGDKGMDFHIEIGQYAKQNNIDTIYTLGELAKYCGKVFYFPQDSKNTYNNINDLLDNLAKEYINFDTILIKGSRFMQMERVIEFLQTLHNPNYKANNA